MFSQPVMVKLKLIIKLDMIILINNYYGLTENSNSKVKVERNQPEIDRMCHQGSNPATSLDQFYQYDK